LAYWVLSFLYRLLDRKRDTLYYLLGVLTAAALFLYVGTDWVVQGATRHAWGIAVQRTPVHVAITSYVGALGLLALGFMALAWKQATSRTRARSLAILTIGCSLAFVFVFTTDVIFPLSFHPNPFPELGSYGVVLISPILYWIVARYDYLRLEPRQVAEQLFESAQDGILLVDASGVIQHANQASRRMVASAKLVGQPVEELIRIVESQKPNVKSSTGGPLYRHIDVTRSKTAHPEIGELVMLRDITEQRLAQDVLRKSHEELKQQVQQRTEELDHAQKMEAIGTIAGGIAHDFNNILAAVVGFAMAAKSDLPQTHRVQKDLDDILMASNRGRGVVQQLMSMTRRRKAYRSLIDGASCVAEAVQLARIMAPKQVSVHFNPVATHTVRADSAQITQVLLNMASNAFQAMNPTGGTLTIETDVTRTRLALELNDREQLPAGQYFQITVSDSGPGMLPEVASHVFDPFFTTKNEEGTGLGLATAHRIVKEHGGAIALHTAPGQGCSFRVLLPCYESEEKGDNDKASAPLHGKERIVVVDDAQQVVRAIRRMLEPLGYTVEGFTDPKEALSFFRGPSNFADLLITDLVMPEMTGIELSEAVLAINPKLPILLVTGQNTNQIQSVTEHSSIRSVLFKPLDPIVLARTIRHQIDLGTAGDGEEKPAHNVDRRS